MHFVIITTYGSPLSMPDGAPILFETEAAARAWLREAEAIEVAPDDVAGVQPLDSGRSDNGR